MDHHEIRGTVFGALCDGDCREPLTGGAVLVYAAKGEHVTEAAAAAPKDTYRIVGPDDARSDSPLGTGTVGADGAYAVAFRREGYDGGPVEVHVRLDTVARPKAGAHEPVQVAVTTVQPQWRQTEKGLVAEWSHVVPHRFWCHILSLFGVWTICGRLTTCDGGVAVPGATVSAFDADWLQDDALGSATTDGTGHFLISYVAADFKRTPWSPWLNVELVGGPDVYFTATLGSTPILTETQSDGRRRGRQNIGPCFCVSLCTDQVHGGGPESEPHWQQVEVFDIHPAPGSAGAAFTTDGDTASGHYFFGGSVTLHGNCPLRHPVSGTSLQYRFLWGEWTWPGPEDASVLPSVAPASMQPMTSQLGSVHVGYVFYDDGTGTTTSHPVVLTAADADPDGWLTLDGHAVTVPLVNPPGGSTVVTVSPSTFLRTFDLAVVNTAAITALHPPKLSTALTKADAGRALTPAEREPVRRYALAFEVRENGGTPGPVLWSDHLAAVVFDNSPVQVALDLEELHANACNPLSSVSTIHLLATVDHPMLRDYAVTISSNAGTVHSDASPGAKATPAGAYTPGMAMPWFRGHHTGPHNGTSTGGQPVDVSADPACAYAVNLSWSTRRWNETGHSTQVLYCH
ncbi:hypothetical protein [Intrasporangium sp. YIM S08009]|uniref:hypothetical protein n=1 Tax=Intrasporangium zincisolvens TaxID=3080018 RepID=UPI002B05E021|nr:hypothetical protein [Intrasporangium sp. YIM S08009]